MVSKKCLPALRRRCPAPHHVFGDRRLGHLKAKHQKFAMDPGCAPKWVFPAHPPDQIAQAMIDLRAPCPLPGLPAPESFEARAMPPQDGLRLNHLGHAEQAWPEPGHPYQQRPITAVQSKTRRRTPQGDAELMTEKQVLVALNPRAPRGILRLGRCPFREQTHRYQRFVVKCREQRRNACEQMCARSREPSTLGLIGLGLLGLGAMRRRRRRKNARMLAAG